MCVKANRAWEVTSGSIEYFDRREIFDLSTINSLIQSKSVQGESTLIYTFYQGKLSVSEFLKYKKKLIFKLKEECGYILKKVNHPDDRLLIIDISWNLGSDIPEDV